MSATLIAASPTSTAGEATEPLPWEPPTYQDASTYLELGIVKNPALREVLAHYASESEPELRLSETIPDAVVIRRSLDRLVDQRIRIFICGRGAELRSNTHVLRWLASTSGQLMQAGGLGEFNSWFGPGSGEVADALVAGEDESAVPTRTSDVVEVVEWMARQLGVPDGDILVAAKIKRRNWHNWKAGRHPRLESQGGLWALLNSVRALSDMFEGDPAPWFAEGGSIRRELLTSGKHRNLVADAFLDASLRGELTTESRRRRRKRSAAGFFQ